MPSGDPSAAPSSEPSGGPTGQPSALPTSGPSSVPSGQPSSHPSGSPTGVPSCCPSVSPSGVPSGDPSAAPSSEPSGGPSGQPSVQPSLALRPSIAPSSSVPTTLFPSLGFGKTFAPSVVPSVLPTCEPTVAPTWDRPTYISSNRAQGNRAVSRVQYTFQTMRKWYVTASSVFLETNNRAFIDIVDDCGNTINTVVMDVEDSNYEWGRSYYNDCRYVIEMVWKLQVICNSKVDDQYQPILLDFDPSGDYLSALPLSWSRHVIFEGAIATSDGDVIYVGSEQGRSSGENQINVFISRRGVQSWSVSIDLSEDSCAYGIQEVKSDRYVIMVGNPKNNNRNLDRCNSTILVIDGTGQLLSSERILSAQLLTISKWNIENRIYITGRTTSSSQGSGLFIELDSTGAVRESITLTITSYDTLLKSTVINGNGLVFALEVTKVGTNPRTLIVEWDGKKITRQLFLDGGYGEPVGLFISPHPRSDEDPATNPSFEMFVYGDLLGEKKSEYFLIKVSPELELPIASVNRDTHLDVTVDTAVTIPMQNITDLIKVNAIFAESNSHKVHVDGLIMERRRLSVGKECTSLEISTSPTVAPTSAPSSDPSSAPTAEPSTTRPSSSPSTNQPTALGETNVPTAVPSIAPTSQPSRVPSVQPSSSPSQVPSSDPTGIPTNEPSVSPSIYSSAQPSTCHPTRVPIAAASSIMPTDILALKEDTHVKFDISRLYFTIIAVSVFLFILVVKVLYLFVEDTQYEIVSDPKHIHQSTIARGLKIIFEIECCEDYRPKVYLHYRVSKGNVCIAELTRADHVDRINQIWKANDCLSVYILLGVELTDATRIVYFVRFMKILDALKVFFSRKKIQPVKPYTNDEMNDAWDNWNGEFSSDSESDAW